MLASAEERGEPVRARTPPAMRDSMVAVIRSVEPLVSVARGIALFVGGFSALNTLAALSNGRASSDLWWIDLSGFSAAFSAAFGVGGAFLLLAFGASPRCAPLRSRATATAAAVLAVVAVLNARDFYAAWHAGSIDPGVPFPFSLVVAAALVYVALAVRHAEIGRASCRERV